MYFELDDSEETKLIRPERGRGPFRTHPLPSEVLKDYEPNDRHEKWMVAIHEHGPQSSAYLRHLNWATHKSHDAVKDAVYKLWCAGYVFRPEDQIATTNPDRNYYVYDLTPKGFKWLELRGLLTNTLRTASDWRHDYLGSCVTTSIQIKAEQAGWRYIPGAEYLDGKPFALNIPFYWGDEIHEVELHPDNLFALSNGKKTTAYLCEWDRGSIKHEPNTWKRRNTKRTLLQYDYLLGQKFYQQAYQTSDDMKLLFVTTSAERGNNVIDLSNRILQNPSWLCLGVVQGFKGKFFKPPAELYGHLFDGPLIRVGYPPWFMKTPT
jgi:hypothetical protein